MSQLILFLMVKDEFISSQGRNRGGIFTLTTVFSIGPEVLQQGGKIGVCYVYERKQYNSLFTYSIIFCIKPSKYFSFSKIAKYKINLRKSIVYLYTNSKPLEAEILKLLFRTPPKHKILTLKSINICEKVWMLKSIKY